MPRFHFHVRTTTELIRDEEGNDYPDCRTAVDEALKGARCLMKGEVGRGTLCLDQSIEIHDGDGLHVRTVPFTEALRVVHEGASASSASVIHIADSKSL